MKLFLALAFVLLDPETVSAKAGNRGNVRKQEALEQQSSRHLNPTGFPDYYSSAVGEIILCDSSNFWRSKVIPTFLSGGSTCDYINSNYYGFDFDTNSIVEKAVTPTDPNLSLDLYKEVNFYLANGARAAIASDKFVDGATNNVFNEVECGPNDGHAYVIENNFAYYQPYFSIMCILTSRGNFAKIAAEESCCGAINLIYQANQAPDCPTVVASDVWLPPNNKMVPISLDTIATDPESTELSIEVTSCMSSDPSNPKKGKDCELTSDGVSVRAKRFGNSDGRLYKIGYTATDPEGLACSGEVFVCIPHDASIGNGVVDAVSPYDNNIEEIDGAWEKSNGKRYCPDPTEVDWEEQLE